MYYLKFIMPPIGSICGFSMWNIYTNYRFTNQNNNFKDFRYEIIYVFGGYLLLPCFGFYLGMNMKNFNLLPKYCISK